MSRINKLYQLLSTSRFKIPWPVFSLRSSTNATPVVTEKDIKDILQTRFINAKEIIVEDVSGGCGAMFNISVSAAEFKGLSIVKQHKAITDTLKDQIKQIHGLRIETKAV